MAIKPKDFKKQDKIEKAKRSMTIFCPHCGRRVHFYAFEKKGKQLCDWCGRYVFKNQKEEFKYRLNEEIKKQKRG